jgi:SAM-dependent methyltransferase
MGITAFDMVVMLHHPQKVAPGAKALTYGKLDVNHITPAMARGFFEQQGREFVNYDGVADDRLISEASYFKNFGFSIVHHADIEAGEGAEVQFDLGETHAEHELYGQYDAIFDFGTIEHVFDLRSFFENTVRFLKIGGRAYHSTPGNGSLDHGFFQPCPTLFWDYYDANQLRLQYVITSHRENQASMQADLKAYDPSLYRNLKRIEQEFGNAVITVFACAERQPESTWDKKPVQHNIRMFYDHLQTVMKARAMQALKPQALEQP